MTDLPIGEPDDTINSVDVDVSISAAQMSSGTDMDVELLNTLCLIGRELVAYRDAELIAPGQYHVGGLLRRGVYNTDIRSHAVGEKFVRMDSNVVKFAYDRALIGKTVFFKLTSYNMYGAGQENIEDVPAYPYQISGPIGRPDSVEMFNISGDVLSWPAVAEKDISGYRIKFNRYQNTDWAQASLINSGVIKSSPYRIEVKPSGIVTLMIKAVDIVGNESPQAAYIVANLGDVLLDNVLEIFDFKADCWPGMLINTIIDDGGNLISEQDSLFFDVDNLSNFYETNAVDFYSESFYGLCWISNVWYPSSVAIGQKLKVIWQASGKDLKIEYRTAGSSLFFNPDEDALFYATDSIQFFTPDPWQPLPNELLAGSDGYQFRITSNRSNALSTVTEFVAQIDVPDKLLTLDDVFISASGDRLAGAANYFSVIKNIQLTLQNTSAVSARVLDKDASLGPLVICEDATQTGVGATIDALIQGY